MSRYFHFSEAGSIAMHAMILIALEKERRLRIRDIADAFGFSEAHLAKVLNRLVRAGLIFATRGPSGGYDLARPAGEISLKDVYEAIEGRPDENRCMFSMQKCDGTGCPLGGFFGEKSREIDERFARITLADVSFSDDLRKRITV
jgi:Rrf2 family protein